MFPNPGKYIFHDHTKHYFFSTTNSKQRKNNNWNDLMKHFKNLILNVDPSYENKKVDKISSFFVVIYFHVQNKII